jgi:flagellar biosynthesis/type III secretory pathway ATPase
VHRAAAGRIRELLAAYRDHEDLISIGAYRRGANSTVDLAIDLQPRLNEFLRQRVDERSSVEDARRGLVELIEHTTGMAPAPCEAPPAKEVDLMPDLTNRP